MIEDIIESKISFSYMVVCVQRLCREHMHVWNMCGMR